MRIINRYITHDYLLAFSLTLGVLTMVLCLGAVVKAIDLAARGLSGDLILRIFLYNVPVMLTFTIPMSALVAALLLFGRLSFDGEINAMKASGLSLWQVVSPVVVLSVVLSGVCAAISMSLAPALRHRVRAIVQSVGLEEPIRLIEAGRFIRDFPGITIYVGRREGNDLEDIVVYEFDSRGPVRNIRARKGRIRADADNRVLRVDLYSVRIDHRERDRETGAVKSTYVNAEHYPVDLDFSRFQKKQPVKKPGDLTWLELAEMIRDIRTFFPELEYRDLLLQRARLVVEASTRMSMSLSCFAFVLLGVPLGMKSRRRESTVGILLSLVIMFVFYCFLVAAKTLARYPDTHADLVVWIPVLVMELAGFLLIQRRN